MTRTAVVTGANQGLGFALAQGLATRLAAEDLVLLTGRDAGRVAAAAERVAADPATRGRVEGRVLDVSDAAAVRQFADDLGPVDIVLSNAIGPLEPGRSQVEQADVFLDVANGGTHAVLRSFGPHLKPGGRLVVVASSLGTLGHLPEALRPRFDGVPLDDVEQAVADWRSAIHDGTAADRGWPEWINVPSKVAQVAAVRAVAAERRDRDLADGTLVAAVCPGLVDTRASRPWFTDFSHAQSPERAAKAVLDLVFADLDPATYGELVRFGRVVPWSSGSPTRHEALIN
ncbi:SDR family NAD(P)-dependent oxidoreductase [Amycolatopsis sp. OK19-0408]|uniref:SDR family NAD(P)-dependent oxidoreductase n=1 Tax=Amycolatopsis iheyensis TaxID=2945988 RepID=A0A9X2NB96_9PSEU|nr:SDR family NAD(P)-dependent oxidoreductase [Amycolatopsis iheyensis]MCR6484647.1 SDR family NAD(P)-dependent oxidoreductase [Amycolatopsis iheyensis]